MTRRYERMGFFESDYGFYHRKAAVLVALFAAAVTCVLGSDRLSVHALGGVLMALFWQQIAFVGHDVGHNAITHDRHKDWWIGIVVGNLLAGVSMGWWKKNHNTHHVVCNSCEHDPDIQHLPFFAVNPRLFLKPLFSTYYNRIVPVDHLTHLILRHQHLLYYPVMFFARINLYIQSWLHALGVGSAHAQWNRRERQWSALFLAGFALWLSALLAALPSWTSRLVFLALSHGLAGILHVQITLSHFSMPTYCGMPYNSEDDDFLQTQLNGSLDIDCPEWFDWFHGGLQFQVEHHLWPRISRHNLRKVRPELRAFCARHGLRYNEVGFYEANAMVYRKLQETARSAKSLDELFRDSFDMRG